uniref:hypothetical protein n=1 Tax=Clostridium sp. NkU-1 TaxID=1095009 RepID=UPI0032612082
MKPIPQMITLTSFRQYIDLKEDVKIDVDYSMSPTFDESSMNEFTYAQLAKITAMISSKSLDVMIGKPDTIDHFGEMGGFIDLKELLPADVYNKVKENLYFVTNQETGEKNGLRNSHQQHRFLQKNRSYYR